MEVFPSLPGIAIEITKTPVFTTGVKASVSGRESRVAFEAYPRWKFAVSFDVLRAGDEAELQQVIGFFLSRHGRFESFLLRDDEDYAVTSQLIGIGDGSATTFQLVRNLGGFLEPIYDPDPDTLAVQVGASAMVLNTDYTLSDGLLTFATAPIVGAEISWSGTFWYRVRFDADEADFERIVRELWQAKQIDMISDKP